MTMPPSSYVLFFSHAPQIQWLALQADIFRKQFGYASILLVTNRLHAEIGLATKSFDQVYDVSTASRSGADGLQLVRLLKEIERSAGVPFVNSSIAMDRHMATRGSSNEEALEFLAHVAGVVSDIVRERGTPKALICEPNLAHYRLAHVMFKDIPCFYVYQLTQLEHRIYFEYSLGYDWEKVGEVYRRLKTEGIPADALQVASRLYEERMQNATLPADTQRFIAQGGNAYLLKRRLSKLVRPAALIEILRQRLKLNNASGLFSRLGEVTYDYLAYFRRVKLLQRIASRKAAFGESYATYYMHQQPEHTVEGVAFEYRDQINTALQIAAALPVGMNLVVKEHPSMIGLRPAAVYNKLLTQKNIRIASLDVPSAAVIRDAKIIFTLSGTVAMEGLLAGTPVVTLGRVYYNHFDGISHFDRPLIELPLFVQRLLDNSGKTHAGSRANSIRALSAMILASYPGKFCLEYSVCDMFSEENFQRMSEAIIQEDPFSNRRHASIPTEQN